MADRRLPRLLLCLAVVSALELGQWERGWAAEATNRTDFHVQCGRIYPQRGTSNCVVELLFTGDALVGKMGNLGVTVTRAIDEAGRDLRLPGEPPFQGSGTAGDRSLAPLRGWFNYNEQQQRRRHAGVTLRPIPPTTKQIKELAGELELYSPTFTNGGVVVCEDFYRTPGTAFPQPALEKWQVRLTWHTKETFQAAQQSAPASPRSGPDPARLFSSWPGDAARNYLVIHAADPEKRIVGFALRGPDGKFLPISNRNSAGNYHGLSFDTLLPEKADLFVYLAVPAAIEKIPFQLENLPLP